MATRPPGPGETRRAILLYAWLGLLMLGVAAAGSHGIGQVRILYVVACLAIAHQALKSGDGLHLELLITMLAFTPWLRRVVDFGCGYDASGMMLIAPLAVAVLPAIGLPALAMARHGPLASRIGVFLVLALCLLYGAMIPVFHGAYFPALMGLAKLGCPLAYGAWLLGTRRYGELEDPAGLMRSAARACAIVTPVVGLYGIAQFLDPPAADRFWMISSQMVSIGLPEPRQVRVFSTMNSPASLGNFLVFAIVAITLLRKRWEIVAGVGPASVALMLCQARTAWLGLAAAILYTLLCARTKARAAFMVATIAVIGTGAVVATPLGEVISTRLETLSHSPGNDGSARDRFADLNFILAHPEFYLVGQGFGVTETTGYSSQSTRANDGIIVASVTAMGMVVGVVFIAGFLWICLLALSGLGLGAPSEFVAAGALILGAVVSSPLNNPLGAEFGILFWSTIAVASRVRLPASGSERAAPLRLNPAETAP